VAIDTASNIVSGKLAIHDYAVDAMTLSPDGSRLYVDGSLGLYVIDGNSLSVTKKVSAISATSQAVTPDGKFLYIANPGNTGNPQESIQVLSTADYAVVKTISLPAKVSAGFIEITPDGSQAWLGEFPLDRGVSSVGKSVFSDGPLRFLLICTGLKNIDNRAVIAGVRNIRYLRRNWRCGSNQQTSTNDEMRS
jgi:DNA-binding beta-propeller fold protein YncE